MGEPIQFPVGRGFDRPYWLSRREGFLVEDAEGMRVGTVVELHYHSRVDQPDELAVRAGRFGHRLLIYRTEAVQAILRARRGWCWRQGQCRSAVDATQTTLPDRGPG